MMTRKRVLNPWASNSFAAFSCSQKLSFILEIFNKMCKIQINNYFHRIDSNELSFACICLAEFLFFLYIIYVQTSLICANVQTSPIRSFSPACDNSVEHKVKIGRGNTFDQSSEAPATSLSESHSLVSFFNHKRSKVSGMAAVCISIMKGKKKWQIDYRHTQAKETIKRDLNT